MCQFLLFSYLSNAILAADDGCVRGETVGLRFIHEVGFSGRGGGGAGTFHAGVVVIQAMQSKRRQRSRFIINTGVYTNDNPAASKIRNDF